MPAAYRTQTEPPSLVAGSVVPKKPRWPSDTISIVRGDTAGAKRHRDGTSTSLLQAVTSDHALMGLPAHVCLVANRAVAVLWQG